MTEETHETNNISKAHGTKDIAHDRHYRLIELAELEAGEICQDMRETAEKAMERIIRCGSVHDVVEALGLYIEYLHMTCHE